jgi:oligopeptide transport system substrate-binding protein
MHMSHSGSRFAIVLVVLGCLIAAGCIASARDKSFFGTTAPPRENVLRYVSGSEPETLDPQVTNLQNEARISIALFEGLAEYDPKTSEPVPALAERWVVNKDWSEVVFYLRHDGRFSNGDPITARDFAYSIRRGLAPEVGSRSASLAYPIKYAQAFNEGGVFVFDSNSKSFLLEKDFAEVPEPPKTETPSSSPASLKPVELAPNTVPETEFHRFMQSPARLVLPGKEKARNAALDANPKLKAAVSGKELLPVTAEAVGVEAVDDYTLRISLMQPAPYILSLIPHQFFRAVHQPTIEKFGGRWTDADKIVTSGPFKLESWNHYDRIVVTREPHYWDAANVHLDKIIFYLLDSNTTMLSLYKSGGLDATYNHTVPSAWLDGIGPMKDFMDASEAAIDYYNFNTTKGPTKDVRVRKALNMSLDKQALADWRHVRPLMSFIPDGIFPGYPQRKGDPFDPEKAKSLLAEAGYHDASGKFDPQKFEASEIELIVNPDANNIAYAEFIQAQWKQNLGTTIPLRIMEGKTFFKAQAQLEYKGVSRTGWSADYLDPFTFLGIFYASANASGWWDAKYVELLDRANRTTDHQKRFELLAQAEQILLDAQPVIPMTVGTTRWMKKPYVKGLFPNPVTLHSWKAVYIERDPSKWDYGMPDMSK